MSSLLSINSKFMSISPSDLVHSIRGGLYIRMMFI